MSSPEHKYGDIDPITKGYWVPTGHGKWGIRSAKSWARDHKRMGKSNLRTKAAREGGLILGYSVPQDSADRLTRGRAKRLGWTLSQYRKALMAGGKPQPVDPDAELREAIRRLRTSRRNGGFGVDTSGFPEDFKPDRKSPEPREKNEGTLIDMIVEQGGRGEYLTWKEGQVFVNIAGDFLVENRLTWAHKRIHVSKGGTFSFENRAAWAEILNAHVSDRVGRGGILIPEEAVILLAQEIDKQFRPATADDIKRLTQKEAETEQVRLLSTIDVGEGSN